MTTNVKTAAEWDQVIDNLELIKKSALTQARELRTQLESLQSQRLVFLERLSRAAQANDPELNRVIQLSIDDVTRRIEGNRVVSANVLNDINQLDQDLNNAFTQRAIALSGPPQDNSNTPPASNLPIDPTDVAPFEPPVFPETQPRNVADDDATQNEADFINAEVQRQATEFELGATQDEIDFIRAEEQLQIQTEIGASQIDFIRAEEQLQIETELGATQNEADFIARAQLEADQNEYAFGGTQAEADFINEQKSISDQEAALGAAGASQAEADAINQAVEAQAEERRLFSKGTTSALYNAQSQASQQDSTNAYAQNDWRVRLQLAPGSKYLYNSDTPGILAPLITTRGVLFPYTPAISVNYAANYDATTLTHSNYKIFQYGSSSVDQISISCDFTAQDAMEARYLLAVIHFFRSVTKMFYGQDKNPLAGTPPPLCYITGMGQFQFDRHPLVISSFNMSLPTDVDYIRAANATNVGVNTGGEVPRTNTSNPSKERLNSGTTPIGPGGIQAPPSFPSTPGGSIEATYVPTKMQIQISAYPIVTRNDISNNFSLEKYATGELLRGSKNKGGAGIW